MSGKLFTPEERAICEKLADFKGELINKRAAVLIMLDDGKTQSQTCEESGMSLGQVRYALTLFKQNGMSMFPQEEQTEEKEEKEVVAPKKKEKNKEKKEAKKKKSCKCKKKNKKKMQKASKPKKKKKKKKK